jgi:hypothetical protein
MKKVLVVIGIVIVVVTATCLIFLSFLGFFKKIKTAERMTGPYTYVYRDFKGPYSKTKKVFDEVYEIVRAEGIEPAKGIGVYYDDPAKVSANELRSRCGCIIEGPALKKLPVLKEKLKTDKIPERKSLVVEFPVKNKISYMIGPLKAYPALAKAAQEKNYTFTEAGIEIYDVPAKKIYYIFQLAE